MASISSSSSAGTVEAASVDTVLGSGSFNASSSETNPGSDPTKAVSNTQSNESAALSTPLLVGVIVVSVVAFVVVFFVIRSRRRRYDPKLFSPSNMSVFQGVTSTTASDHASNTLGESTASTVVTSPQPAFMQTLKLPRLPAKDAANDHVALDVHDAPVNGLSIVRATPASRTTSLIRGRSVFSASILSLRSSLPSLVPFRTSRANEANTSNVSSMSTSHDPNSSVELRRTEGDAWRDLSETCWSIDPGSDSETESERFTMPSHGETLVLNRNRLSTLSDGIADIEEEDPEKAINSLDDSSRRRELVLSSMDDLSPRRERGISQFDDSSPRRVRGLSALESRRKANSLAELDTNTSGGSYFSVDSDFYDETIKDCSSFLFDDSDSDSLSSNDSGDSLREEEF